MSNGKGKTAVIKSLLLFGATTTLAVVSGCATHFSEAPIATNFPTTKQHKLQAGTHWNAVAADAAGSLADALKLGKGCIAPTPECDTVFVREPRVQTAFSQAFRNQFITSLVNRGLNVAKAPGVGIEIDFEIQPLKFTEGRRDGNFTSATAIYAGLWALHGLWEDVSHGAAGLAATGAFDLYRWNTSELAAGPTPQHEVIVTVSAGTANRYLGRVTNVYYFAFSDETLYQPLPAPPRLTSMSVTGDCGPAPCRTTMPVTGGK